MNNPSPSNTLHIFTAFERTKISWFVKVCGLFYDWIQNKQQKTAFDLRVNSW